MAAARQYLAQLERSRRGRRRRGRGLPRQPHADAPGTARQLPDANLLSRLPDPIRSRCLVSREHARRGRHPAAEQPDRPARDRLVRYLDRPDEPERVANTFRRGCGRAPVNQLRYDVCGWEVWRAASPPRKILLRYDVCGWEVWRAASPPRKILFLARTGDVVASTSEKETIRERRSREPILKRLYWSDTLWIDAAYRRRYMSQIRSANAFGDK